MKHILITSAIGIILMSVSVGYVQSSLEKEKLSYSKNIGKEVVIGKDTSVIVDYSSISQSYMLSNGTTVSKEFVK
jgi:hypothetical protein